MSEIERKFLIAALPADLGEGSVVRQGYLALDGTTEVRVRERRGRHTLTVKGGRGRERAEVEVEIGGAAFAELWPLAAARSVVKRRHEVAVDGGTAEVDLYEERLAGLAVVEVEFATPEEADRFRPPGWFGREVTEDGRYANARLAVDGPPADAG